MSAKEKTRRSEAPWPLFKAEFLKAVEAAGIDKDAFSEEMVLFPFAGRKVRVVGNPTKDDRELNRRKGHLALVVERDGSRLKLKKYLIYPSYLGSMEANIVRDDRRDFAFEADKEDEAFGFTVGEQYPVLPIRKGDWKLMVFEKDYGACLQVYDDLLRAVKKDRELSLTCFNPAEGYSALQEVKGETFQEGLAGIERPEDYMADPEKRQLLLEVTLEQVREKIREG